LFVVDTELRVVVADATQVLPSCSVSRRHLATEQWTTAGRTTSVQL